MKDPDDMTDAELVAACDEAEIEAAGALLAHEARVELMTDDERSEHFEFVAEREIDGAPAMVRRRLDNWIDQLKQGETE